jgi:hypothetical protein
MPVPVAALRALAIRWQLVDDFRRLVSDWISNQPFPRPSGWDIVILAAGKARILRAYSTLVQWRDGMASRTIGNGGVQAATAELVQEPR